MRTVETGADAHLRAAQNQENQKNIKKNFTLPGMAFLL